jgi:hypothetical protein
MKVKERKEEKAREFRDGGEKEINNLRSTANYTGWSSF